MTIKSLVPSLLLTISALCSATGQEKIKVHPERKDVAGISDTDAEMNAAQEKARATLKSFIIALMDREPDKRYLLKVAIKEGEEVEHVWLEPVKWNDPGLVGLLAVEPVAIKKHKRGDLISPLPDDVSDWLILSKDGTKKGGYTDDVIQKREEEAKSKAEAK